jgi:hypothetical protein
MISREAFSIQTVQASAFVADNSIKPSAILLTVLKNMSGEYNGVPISLPVPNDLSSQIPSVIVSSEDKTRRLDAARGRINLLRTAVGTTPLDLRQVLTDHAGELATIAEESKLTIGRIAAVVTRLAPTINPGRALAEQFCREPWLSGPLQDVEGFELHAHSIVRLERDLRVNEWIRIKTAGVVSQRYQEVLVEQDVNTLAEELPTRTFPPETLVSTFGVFTVRLDERFSSYFREEGHGL